VQSWARSRSIRAIFTVAAPALAKIVNSLTFVCTSHTGPQRYKRRSDDLPSQGAAVHIRYAAAAKSCAVADKCSSLPAQQRAGRRSDAKSLGGRVRTTSAHFRFCTVGDQII
jgi:hypothetical protein